MDEPEIYEVKISEDGKPVRVGKPVKFPEMELIEETTISLADIKANGIDAIVTHKRRNMKTGEMEVVNQGTIRSAVDKLEKLLPEKPAPDSVLGEMIADVRSLDDKN